MSERPLRVMTVVGARPQFVKAAVVSRAIAEHNARGGRPIDESIVHTGQHYDEGMSRVFFEELRIPTPRVNLGVGSGSHGRQTGQMLEKIDELIREQQPDWVLVYGDTNSTLAGALAAAKLHVPVAHVEAGLRSFNRRMPEEVNRVLTDHVSTLLLCPTSHAVKNLAGEGITENVHAVGDVMYDSVRFYSQMDAGAPRALDTLGLAPRSYYLATVHRAENTDDPERMAGILDAFRSLPHPVVLPLHPRTRRILDGVDLGGNIRVVDPVPYLQMLQLARGARVILTDSGGLQKEAFWLAVPCVTLRDETEWVELVEEGCNTLVGASEPMIRHAVESFEARDARLPEDRQPNLYGDGHSGEAIVRLLVEVAATDRTDEVAPRRREIAA